MTVSAHPIRWAVVLFVLAAASYAADSPFKDAPASAKAMKNPLAGQQAAFDAGKTVYARNCLSCHGRSLQGTGNVPSLIDGKLKGISQGEIFWFITKGDKDSGMPAWGFMPENTRWQVVSYVEAIASGKAPPPASSAAPAATNSSAVKDASPTAPFTDFRYEKPGTIRKITVKDLPAPFATKSSSNGPDVVARPDNAWPVAAPGFKVELYASGLENPRLMRTAPNGDIFLAETEPGRIVVFRGVTSDGKAEQSAIFASGLKQPYGIAFYPPGPDPQWVYIGNMASVVRFPYHNGDLTATGEPQHVADLPDGGGHTTRAVDFSKDGSKLFVAVGSASNVDDPDTTPGEKDRADILVCDPNNCQLKVYAYGIRNAGGGIRVESRTPEISGARSTSGMPWATILSPTTSLSVQGGRFLRLAVVVHGRPSGPATPG